MTDETGDKAPWTIKSVPVVTRELAIRSARQAGLTAAEWLVRAVEHQAERDRSNLVIPPGQPGQSKPSHAIARYDTGTSAAVSTVALDLAALAQAIRAAVDVSQAATEAPALRGLARDVSGLIRDQVRQARGLSPMGRRRPVADDEGG